MLSDVVDKRIQEVSDVGNELSYILPRDGWTDYAFELLARLQKLTIILDDEDERADGMFDAFKNAWMSTKDGQHIYIGEDGNPEKGNPHLLAAIEGAIENTEKKARKDDMKCEKPVTYEKSGAITKSKDGWRITHFDHDENEMNVTRQVYVQDQAGQNYKVCRGKIEHLTVFAAGDMERQVDIAEDLSEHCGGKPDEWKHVKGIGTVVDMNGKQKRADLHWFENPETGQVGWKIKQFLEEMDESQIYW